MRFLPILFALVLTACGGGGGNQVETVAFRAGQVTCISNAENPDELACKRESLTGTGLAVFGTTSMAIKEDRSFALDFTLEDGGALTLVGFGDDTLGGGFEVEFRRQGSGPGSLIVTLKADGQSRNTVNAAGHDVFSGFDAARPLKFQIDLHNSEDQTHVMIWSRLVSDDFHPDLSILDTGDDIEKGNGSPGSGKSTYWGLKLRRAVVTEAAMSAPKYAE